MQRTWRRASVAAVTLLAATVCGVGSSSAVSQAVALGEGDSPLTSLGACMLSTGSGDVMLLMDQSDSLDDSDPGNVRIPAAQYLLKNLATYASENSIDIDVRISGFDIGYRTLTDWTTLDGAALPNLDATLTSLAESDGRETDYWTALEGARKDLAERPAPAEGQERCQGLIFFTDGVYDLNTRITAEERVPYGGLKPYAPGVQIDSPDTKAAVERAGVESLCRPGGLADAVRSAGVVVTAVGLEGPDTSGSQFGLIQRVATGADEAGTSCGELVEPQPGEFFLASDVDGLIFAFERAIPGGPNDPGPLPVCPVTTCAEYTYPFVLDASIRTVHILAGATETGIAITLSPPGAEPVVFTADNETGSIELGSGHSLEYEWVTDKTIEIDMTQASGPGWTGEWGLTFVDTTGTHPDALARTLIRIKGDLVPAWPEASTFTDLRSGDVEQLTFAIQHEGSDEPVPPAEILGDATLSASLRTADGRETVIAENVSKDEIDDPVTLDLAEASPGRGLVVLRLAVTTAPVPAGAGAPAREGTALAEQVAQFPITVGSPPNYPEVVDAALVFPRTEGVGPAQAALTVQGPGCVWVDSAQVTVSPDGVGSVTVAADSATSAETCLEIGDETATLPVSLTVETPGNGPVAGTLQVRLAPADATDRAIPAAVEFTGDLVKPADKPTFWLAFVIAMIVGLGLPPLFLLLAKHWTARIPSGGGIWATPLPSVVVDGAVHLATGGSFDATSGTRSFVTIGPKGQRELSIPEAGVTLSTKAGLNPFSSARVIAEAAGGRPSVAGTAPHQDGSGRAVLPLAVHNQWIAWNGEPPQGNARPVTVLVLASGTATAEVYDRITTEVQELLPDLMARLDGGGDSKGVDGQGGTGGAGDPYGPGDPHGTSGTGGSLRADDDFAPPPPSRGLGGDDW